jgi:hypothetical protein
MWKQDTRDKWEFMPPEYDLQYEYVFGLGFEWDFRKAFMIWNQSGQILPEMMVRIINQIFD